MKKRLLSLEDLYNFYASRKNSCHFNYAESTDKEPIVVQVKGKLSFESNDNDTEGLLPVSLEACHTNLNINKSNINEDVMLKALPSFSNRPILGYIHKVDGQYEFYSHNFHEDDDGEIVYDEVPIGIIPESCEAKLSEEDNDGKRYVLVNGYIFEEYSKAAEILQREQECPVSIEISIREMSYNAKACFLDIEDFFFSGVTILGKTDSGENVNPGMVGSNIKLADFSAENNSMFSDKSEKFEQQLIEMQSKLDELISRFNINENKGKEETTTLKLEELLKKYNKTKEDITFDYESLSDEELEAKFAEMFEETPEDTGAEGGEDNSTNGDPVEGNTENSNTAHNNEPENNTGNFEKRTFRTVDENGKMTVSYEISHEDIKYSLYNLLAPFEDADNEWYFIIGVYDTYFAYENWEGSRIYGQKYTVDGDKVAFDDERYSLHRELLTDSEYTELKTMRENYASLVQFKSDTENAQLHSQREDILSNKTYAVLAEKETDSEGNETYKNKAYAKLVAEMDNYSPADLEKELKSVFADYITNGGQFSYAGEEKKPQVSKKQYASLPTKSKTGRYGNLFKEKEK